MILEFIKGERITKEHIEFIENIPNNYLDNLQVLKAIDEIIPCSTFNFKKGKQCNDKNCIGCGINKKLKKELGLE